MDWIAFLLKNSDVGIKLICTFVAAKQYKTKFN